MNQEITTLVANLVNIDSVYPNEEKIANYLFDFLKSNKFRVEKQKISPGRFNLFASKGHSKKNILFYGHIDTIPLVNQNEWKSNPNIAIVKNDRLYGLGASDMKGGLAAFLFATKDTTSSVKIFLASDEENISEGAWKAVKEYKSFFDDVKLVISAEPSFGLGLNGITIGRTGRCIYEISFKGKPEHIIKYKKAIDSLELLSKFGVELYKNRETLFKSKDTVAQLRKVSGEAKGMSVCGEASAEIEVILGAEDGVKNALFKLQGLSKSKVTVKTRRTPYLEGYLFKDFPNKKLIGNIIKKHTKKPMKLFTRKSVGDDNVLATLDIPVITWGPEGGNEHKPNEFVDLASVETLSKMYGDLLTQASKEKG